MFEEKWEKFLSRISEMEGFKKYVPLFKEVRNQVAVITTEPPDVYTGESNLPSLSWYTKYFYFSVEFLEDDSLEVFFKYLDSGRYGGKDTTILDLGELLGKWQEEYVNRVQHVSY